MAARILIAGGGFAAVEAMVALRALAPRETSVTVLAPDPVLRYRPAASAEAFDAGPARGYELGPIARGVGAIYLSDRLEAVFGQKHQVRTASGARLEYDILILAIGARPVAGVPGALTFRDQRDTRLLERLLNEIWKGSARTIAFVVPPGPSWGLPIYELALLCANRAARDDIDVEVSLVTPEQAPLGLFGPRVSRRVRDLLTESGVRFLGQATAIAARRDGTLLTSSGSLAADRVVAAPSLRGRRVTGVPATWWGFVPTDQAGRVEGLTAVYAAGDMTTFAVKHGGLGTQQADRIAHELAESLGVAVKEVRHGHVLQAVFVGGEQPLLLRSELDWDGQPTSATLERIDHQSGRLTKVFGRYLAPYLEKLEPVSDGASGSRTRTVVPEGPALTSSWPPVR